MRGQGGPCACSCTTRTCRGCGGWRGTPAWRRRRSCRSPAPWTSSTARCGRGGCRCSVDLFARRLLGVELGPDDVPPFAARPDWCPAFLETSIKLGLVDAGEVLVNSFCDIEPKDLGSRLLHPTVQAPASSPRWQDTGFSFRVLDSMKNYL